MIPMNRLTFATGLLVAMGGVGIAAHSLHPASIVMSTATIAAAPGVPDTPADAVHPTVVELYQSQGCSSCPPANANVNAIADRPGILALNFAVTYWDYLGWKDVFAAPAYTARQWEYANAAGRVQVSTPQVIINGRAAVVGSNAATLAAAIRDNARKTPGPAIAASAGRVTVGAAPESADATVWLVRYDPRNLAVPIRAGENDGRTLDHRNIVRSLAVLGNWRGATVSFPIPAGDPAYRSAILVQRGKGGPIIAAARI
ncbi:DUF1223 domain-containing protein [soil metagenome]